MTMLDHLPQRGDKPRSSGVTMVMDKGIGIRQARDLVETTGHLIDFLKLGFGTSFVTRHVKEKVQLYRENGINVYVGGTLLEAFLVRGQFDDYRRFVAGLGCDAAEVSDGCIPLPKEHKCEIIARLAEEFIVLSEVGSKSEDDLLSPAQWIEAMQGELAAGSRFVIGEARESGTVGIYGSNGSADTGLINEIIRQVPPARIIWEAPQKKQQAYFIRLLGPSVNLGNISPTETAALETLRLGLRGDTFTDFLPGHLREKRT